MIGTWSWTGVCANDAAVRDKRKRSAGVGGTSLRRKLGGSERRNAAEPSASLEEGVGMEGLAGVGEDCGILVSLRGTKEG